MISPELEKLAREHLGLVSESLKKVETWAAPKNEALLKALKDQQRFWEKTLGG